MSEDDAIRQWAKEQVALSPPWSENQWRRVNAILGPSRQADDDHETGGEG